MPTQECPKGFVTAYLYDDYLHKGYIALRVTCWGETSRSAPISEDRYEALTLSEAFDVIDATWKPHAHPITPKDGSLDPAPRAGSPVPATSGCSE